MVEPLPKWEYHVEPNRSFPTIRLNDLGAAGWELVDVQGATYIFRRTVPSFVERVTMEQRATYYRSLGLDPESDR